MSDIKDSGAHGGAGGGASGGGRWLNDLNNAINTLVIAVSLIRRAIASGDEQGVKAFFGQVEDSADRCRELAVAASRRKDDADASPSTPP